MRVLKKEIWPCKTRVISLEANHWAECQSWCLEHLGQKKYYGITLAKGSFEYYFKSESDMLMFILRWK